MKSLQPIESLQRIESLQLIEGSRGRKSKTPVSMTRQRGFTFIELIAVSVIIGVLFVSGMRYYGELMADARKAGLAMLANRFAAASAGAHLKWTIDGRPNWIILDGYQLRMNRYGWPVGEALGAKQGLNTCRQLWESLLQNPVLIADAFPQGEAGINYWVDKPQEGICRYRLISQKEEYYFEYHLLNGKVRASTEGQD